jgi:hypothetical protein
MKEITLLGPLEPLLGVWEGQKGDDVAPSDDRKTFENNKYRERMTFEMIKPLSNHEQALCGLRYSIKIVNVHPPHRLEKERDWFGEHLKIVTKKYPDITINVINAPPKTWLFVISEYGDARPETIKKVTEHTALSIENVDPASGVDLMKTFVLLGSTMGLIYLSDKNEEEAGFFPGEGTMPLESLLIKLGEVQYNGDFTLDVAPKHL